MKKILFAFAILFFCTDGEAQLIDLDKIINRTERKISRRIQRKVDRTVADGLNKAEDAAEGKSRNNKYEDEDYDSPVVSKEKDVDELPQNGFVGKMKFHVEIADAEGNAVILPFKYISKKYSSIMIPEEGYHDIDFIYVNNSNKSVIVAKNVNDRLTGTKDWFKYFEEVDESSYTIEKTSDTDMMNDYICRKYYLDTDNTQVINWITREIELDYAKFLMELNYLEILENNLHELNPTRLPSLDALIELESGETIGIKMTEIVEGNFDFSNYDVSEYSLLDYTEY